MNRTSASKLLSERGVIRWIIREEKKYGRGIIGESIIGIVRGNMNERRIYIT